MEATLDVVVTVTLWHVPTSVSVSVPTHAWADHIHQTFLPRAQNSQDRLSIIKCQAQERNTFVNQVLRTAHAPGKGCHFSASSHKRFSSDTS